MSNIGKVGIWLILSLLSAAAQAGTKYYYYTDPQGTVLAEADAQGNIIARYDYAPYGKQVLGTPPSGPAGYTGHVNDAESGLVYMQARYYDPVVGRFLSVDPVNPSAGNVSNFNRYVYANSNPIVNIDPDGRNGVTAFGGLLYESGQFLQGNGFDSKSVMGALGDGYDGEGDGFARSAFDDATTFIPVGALASGAIKLARVARVAIQAQRLANFSLLRYAATSAQRPYKGSTVIGHALSKHAGRNPSVWGKISGPMKSWNEQGMKNFREIMKGPGEFHEIVNKDGTKFMEKALEDGRGVRLNMDGTFKGFIDI